MEIFRFCFALFPFWCYRFLSILQKLWTYWFSCMFSACFQWFLSCVDEKTFCCSETFCLPLSDHTKEKFSLYYRKWVIMENLIFSLNATVPVFLMMILGLVFKKIGLIDDIFASNMNKFVFMVPLPVLVFEDLATVDFSKVWDIMIVLISFIDTMISITISFLISWLLWEKTLSEEIIK